jgi:hypothetical protein
VILDFENYMSRPSWLNPRRGLMHAEPEARIRASAFDQSNQVSRNGDAFMRHREDEFVGLEAERIELSKLIPELQFLGFPEPRNLP